jgi:acetoin utilization deacetylase AcuC-like enzyme
MTRVGFIYNPIYLEHDTGNHVENTKRLTSVMSLLEENHLIDMLTVLPPRPATLEELSKIHAKEYVAQVQSKCENGGGWFDADTVASRGSYQAAIHAAGGVITAVDAVMQGSVDTAFALVRPPGHHATCWHAMGFCLFNNIAIAAKYALANYNIERTLIIDFDVHHGNGTQDAFYTDPNVLYFSTHQYPLYPGTGSINETGARAGDGFTVNVPLIAGWGDKEYEVVFEDILAPIAMRFKPQLILVSAGYDAHWADNIAMMKLSVTGFSRLTEIIKVLSDTLCQGNLVFALEGGYHHVALSASVAASLNILLGNKEIMDPLGKQESATRPVNFDGFIKTVKDKHQLK